MTEEADPAVAPTPEAAPPPIAPRATPSSIATMDPAALRIAGAGIAVAVIAAIGGVLNTWVVDWSAIVLILAGLLAAGAAVLASGAGAKRSMPIPARDVILAGGTIAAALGVLFLLEVVFDFDDLDDYGGIPGAVAALALAVAGVVLYLTAANAWSGGPMGPWTRALAGDRATKLVLGGAALVVLGWLGNATIGVWYLDSGVVAITAVLLAAIAVRAAGDLEQPLVLPFPVAYVAVGLTALAAIIALQHTAALADQGVSINSWIPQLVYVAGVGIALVGAILGAMESVRGSLPAASGPGGTAAG